MLELLTVLMCGGGGGSPAPAFTPTPTVKTRGTRYPTSDVRRQQAQNRSSSGSGGGGFGSSTRGDLFTGTQGIGDMSLSTGKTLLGG